MAQPNVISNIWLDTDDFILKLARVKLVSGCLNNVFIAKQKVSFVKGLGTVTLSATYSVVPTRGKTMA